MGPGVKAQTQVTSAMLIWIDAWSLAPMILLLAELENRNTPSSRLKVTMVRIRAQNSPFTRDVKVHEFTSVVLHVVAFDKRSPTNLEQSQSPHITNETPSCLLGYEEPPRRKIRRIKVDEAGGAS